MGLHRRVHAASAKIDGLQLSLLASERVPFPTTDPRHPPELQAGNLSLTFACHHHDLVHATLGVRLPRKQGRGSDSQDRMDQ